MSFAFGRKCYVHNWTVTKFCDIGTGDSFSFGSKMEFHFRRHFRLRPKMKNAFSVGLYIKPFRITPYVNDFQTLNNPGSRQPAGASINEFCPAFWHKSFILHHHHHRRSVVRVNRCAAPWPLMISDLHGVDRSKRWHPPESWILLSQTFRGRPGGLLQLRHWLSAFVLIHHPTQSIMCWYSRVQACNMAKQR